MPKEDNRTAREKYADIIDLPRPKSKHPPMSLTDRGAQFAPFAALTGFDNAIEDTAQENLKEMDNEKPLERGFFD
ncbi:MAG: hypothetical protein HUK21_08165 [Fibrobacteraceae bacterium]|nr:hypothetical protein [Fibrobacteraceae bacterium]